MALVWRLLIGDHLGTLLMVAYEYGIISLVITLALGYWSPMSINSLVTLFLCLLGRFLPIMLVACLRSMGHAVSKNLSITEGLDTRKSWKFLRRPWVLRCTIAFLAVFYVGIPISFCLCPWVRRGAIYMHFADWPFQNLSSPEYYSLQNTRHFFVETSPGTVLGVWHVSPYDSPITSDNASYAHDNQLVVLYLHGSAESRSAAYRRSMYRVLSSDPIGAHVITFDYRGFGDSTYVSPTAKSIEEDATAMFDWLKQQVPLSRIIVWGHSMGTGIAVRLGEALAKKNSSNPLAIILEAPFTSVADATHTFPLSFFHRRLPFFQKFCSEMTRHPDTNLDSVNRVGHVTAPLLIFHAEDDSMVWSQQGKNLWKRAVQERQSHLQKPVFVELDGKYSCGHRNIHRAPNLPHEILKFLSSVRDYEQIT